MGHRPTVGPTPPFSVSLLSSRGHEHAVTSRRDITACWLNIRPWTAGSWDSSGSHFGLKAVDQQTVVVIWKNSAVFTRFSFIWKREGWNSLKDFGPSTLKQTRTGSQRQTLPAPSYPQHNSTLLNSTNHIWYAIHSKKRSGFSVALKLQCLYPPAPPCLRSLKSQCVWLDCEHLSVSTGITAVLSNRKMKQCSGAVSLHSITVNESQAAQAMAQGTAGLVMCLPEVSSSPQMYIIQDKEADIYSPNIYSKYRVLYVHYSSLVTPASSSRATQIIETLSLCFMTFVCLKLPPWLTTVSRY